MAIIIKALQEVFSHKRYILAALVFAAIIFSVVNLIPVGRFSYKALYYQVTSLDQISVFNTALFSILAGILLSMNIYLLIRTHEDKKKVVGSSIISIAFSFIAGIFGSAVCIACVTILVGFLGTGVTTALIGYRRELFLVSAVISLVSIYFVSKAIAEHGKCKVCVVQTRKPAK